MDGPHVMQSDVFRVELPGDWQAQPLPGAPMGDAAFVQPGTGFSFFQTVMGPGPDGRADSVDTVRAALNTRLDALAGNGHAVEPGRIAFTKRDYGPVGICDLTLDGQRYAVMVGYGFADCVLIHFMDGDPSQSESVRNAVQGVLDGVSHTGGAA